MTEIWHITWFCLTMANPTCAALHNKIDGAAAWLSPNSYYSESQCMSFAESKAERWFNEEKFQVEYGCTKVKTLTPYVPARRF